MLATPSATAQAETVEEFYTGKTISFLVGSKFYGRNRLVLMFNRSAGWCPYCQAQMMDVVANRMR